MSPLGNVHDAIPEAMRRGDSLTRQRMGSSPQLSHILSVGNGRVLSLAADDKHVYAGCQSRDNEITVFSRSSLQPLFRLLGHEGSVLALLIVKEKGWLVASSSAGDVRIWSTKTFQPLYIINPCDNTSGDIYSLAWDDRAGGTLYFGAQNTSIEWVNFGKPLPGESSNGGVPSLVAVSQSLSIQQSNGASTPSQRSGRYKPHTFFDTPPADVRSGTSTPRTPMAQPVCGSRSTYLSVEREVEAEPEAVEFEVDCDSIVFSAHYGYVYALEMIRRLDGTWWLASGSGDSDIKIWHCNPGGGLSLVREFNGLTGAVLSFAHRDSLLYAGLQDGEIDVWDLETGARIRTIEAHESDVMAMTVLGSDVYTGAADGRVLRINGAFDCTAAFNAHGDSVLACTIVRAAAGPGYELITAGNDSFVKIWTSLGTSLKSIHDTDVEVDLESNADVMLYALSKLVAIPTVSDEKHRESCRQGAHLLHKILGQLGARSEMLSGDPGKNPLVLATFQGRDTGKPRKRVLFYGHYDVQPAGEKDWESDPWELNGRNGYLYGRGVSDNKGPVLAVACAAAALQQRRELDVDLVMIVEGEEEAGSRGFANSVRKHKESIGHIDVVLLANSTWIDEDDPCVVYGMRGVVYAQLMVQSGGEDAHNGVEGGLVKEPMFDLVQLLSSLADTTGVNVPGFYDKVRPKTEIEAELLRNVARVSGRDADELRRVWCQPTFSIANISTTSAPNKTVISRCVQADIAMRIVPDQDIDDIVECLTKFCHSKFAEFNTPNKLEVNVTHAAAWWLASLDNPYFRALEDAIKDVWGVAPLKIREGGTVPTMSWLEREFAAPCVHLPLGQSSDAGHLANERIRLLNLRNGKRVFERYLTRLAAV
ncbi:uncharacterized protein CcaverHIS019_0104440 [Cutaneotrichosporon cavernicola]|uniref:Peptidase M20 dimerisation domain-containing protein n=1 Tax=Cutaneotrichosporon cavernicola TaxID=279322 RepID=A0AA48KYM9_9TREE|nr:uncharacterized protein CcaverHIS019_0104440 [Cutaneotrichosporon cavernicola]BEI87726.1 hypothetical protein CcaverHIS019_0104440 [Cutaneotrichosporon cavernicola]BEI95497.1 hypothetical protein CcaverHIS631_0104460 [Cutaneotrichosporon cavernicola]BEJ03271.1 hypothetical protein CcaverHIS641_0104460 [Cutaneotrichosporon cavernicola]